MAGLLAFFLGTRRERLVTLDRARRSGRAGLVFEFGDALLSGLQCAQRAFQLPLLHGHEVEQAFGIEPSFAHLLSKLFDGVHAASLSNCLIASCATLPKKPKLESAAIRKLTATIQTVNASNVTIDEFDYVYTDNQLSSETDTQGGSPVTTDYTYNLTGQLTAAGSTSYAYDPNGNPDNTGDTIGTDNEISSDGTYNYNYDYEGNEITKTNISTGDKWTYGYNNANELISAVEKTSGGTTEMDVEYKYDMFGNMLEEVATPYSSGVAGTTTTTKYALSKGDSDRS